MASVSDERPCRSMVTISSALSSSSDLTMRSRISGAFTASLGAVSRFTTEAATFGFLAATVFFAADVFFAAAFGAVVFFAAGFAVFFGAFAAPVVLRVRIQILQGYSRAGNLSRNAAHQQA